jgi:hypothetical protein
MKLKIWGDTMNVRLLLGILLLVLIFAGCSKPLPPPVQETVQPPPVEPVVAPPVVPPKPVLNADIAALIAKTSKISSYQYIYKSSEDPKAASNYYIKADKIRIHYGSLQDINKFPYTDIYFDTTKRAATLVCTGYPECRGNRAKEVAYGDYKLDTPLEVVARINNGEITERPQIDNKNTVVIRYNNTAHQPESIWLWEYYGIPLKREITQGSSKLVISYDKLVVDPNPETAVDLPSGLEMV